MRVAIICPAPAGSRLGNRITALRWARMLRELGHRAFIAGPGPAPRCDLLIALHARRSAESVRSSKTGAPARPVALALTGTDLYVDIHQDADAARSLALADRLIVLHAGAAAELPRRLRGKVALVPQSAPVPARKPGPIASAFEVAVVAHLRPEKDPLRAAAAARLLPPASRIRVVHAGRALSPQARAEALCEERENPRYRWLGEVPLFRARALIGRARLLAVTSRIEGGANVVSEAVAAGTPIIASRIPSMEAILGRGHAGLFPFGDTRALARLLSRAEDEPAFLERLRRRSIDLRPALSPAREKAALRALLAGLALPKAVGRPRRRVRRGASGST
jgi:putative glycosyltransferase (TIGR04348 family)